MSDVSPPLSLELSIPSEFGYERVVREAVASFARRIGLNSERVEDLKTAVSEACLNAIEHGNAQMPEMRVGVNCVWENDGLTIRVLDHGLKRYAGLCARHRVQGAWRGAAARYGVVPDCETGRYVRFRDFARWWQCAMYAYAYPFDGVMDVMRA